MNQPVAEPKAKRIQFISLRLKLLVGFTVVYGIVFATAYGWFYRYSTDRAMQRIRQDLVDTLEGTIQGIDGDEFRALAAAELPNGQILPLDNPLYQKHQAWLQTIHQIEPRANPYTLIPGSHPYEVLFIGDFLRISQPDSPTHFRESYTADPAKTQLYQGLTHLTITLTPYKDQWGSWVSAYGPIKDKHGSVVGVVGVDFQANYVFEVQQGIRQHFAIAFGITYGSLFILVYIISGIVTRPITELVVATEQMSEGAYNPMLSHLRKRRFHDEMSMLAETFERMVEKIRKREEQLQDYNQSLEEKVNQRTEELQAKNTQLANANMELARATRLKDEFLANMSHELRTPLNAILGMTEGLQDQVFGAINEQQIHTLETIERSGYHLLELINDILNIAKIESGQLELDYSPTAVAPLCQSSLTFISQQALTKRIQVELKLPTNLPDLWVDERRIRQVLLNLLSNAVKFTPEGGHITLEVSPCAQEREPDEKRFLRIAVIDTGIGIAPEYIHQLFQPFIQIDSALNRKYEGTGLGLALVKRIVELHGGYVELTTEVGVGSCFTIALPCLDSTVCSAVSPVPAQCCIQPLLLEQTSSPLILLAEDNEVNVVTISDYLKAKGYRILRANNGVEAIALAQSEKPDLILMDIQMPEMDGLEAMRHIRCDANLVNVPIIALTALAMAGDRDRCLEAGANAYLTKPIKLKQLTELLATLLLDVNPA
jgi:signal transduction histidine kinase/ActR/RegA family two-component response regulator